MILLLLACFSYSHGQERRYSKLLNKAFLVTNKKGFRGQYLKGSRNGMGLLALRKGYVYIGDFYNEDISGFGMLIASEGNYIDNCEGCAVYVGNWRNNKKNGRGTCYKEDGTVIYSGIFSEDKPTGNYPSDSLSINRQQRFSFLELNDGKVFLGETHGDDADGLGIIAFSGGDLWLSSFKKGQSKGIGLYLYCNGEWETFNYQDGDYHVVSSSENYRAIDNRRKEIFRDGLNSALLGISDALGNLATTLEQNNNGSIDSNTGESGTMSVSNSGKASKGITGSSKCRECAGNGKCSGSGTSSKYHCHGSGKCYACHGNAYKQTTGIMHECSVCNNTGKCKYCRGTGKCSACGGSGKK